MTQILRRQAPDVGMDYVKFRARKSQTTIKQNENTVTIHYILSEIAEKKKEKKKILATD